MQQQQQQTGFNIAEWLAEDQPPCEGGSGIHICLEYCESDGCPIYRQYIRAEEA